MTDIQTAATYFPDLAARMAAAGISRSALARQLGHRGPAAVSRWLSGRSGARAETLARCEAAYNALLAAQETRSATIAPEGAPEGVPLPKLFGTGLESGVGASTTNQGAIVPLRGTIYLSVQGPLPPTVESAAVEGGTFP